jgi:hypothetical protein
VFGWPDPNTGFDQSEHALYTCYFIKKFLALYINLKYGIKHSKTCQLLREIVLYISNAPGKPLEKGWKKVLEKPGFF